MRTGLTEKMIQQLELLAGLQASPLAEEQIQQGPITQATGHCIIIEIGGGRRGWFALCASQADAISLSSKIISRAVSADFPPENVDVELAANTLGEYLNILLGDYFMEHKSAAGPTSLNSPRYSNVQKEMELLKSAGEKIGTQAEGLCIVLYYSAS